MKKIEEYKAAGINEGAVGPLLWMKCETQPNHRVTTEVRVKMASRLKFGNKRVPREQLHSMIDDNENRIDKQVIIIRIIIVISITINDLLTVGKKKR